MKYLKKYNEVIWHKDEYIQKILNSNGYKIIKSIKGGAFGHTFELEESKVCKVCYDRDEIRTANKMIGKKSN